MLSHGSRTYICELPTDLLSRIAFLTASPETMARFSQACRLLREPCEDAAVDRGYELGYDESRVNDGYTGLKF